MSIKDGPGEGTWSVFAQKVVEERDAALEAVARLAECNDAMREPMRKLRDVMQMPAQGEGYVIDSIIEDRARLQRIVEDYDRRFVMLAKIAQGIDETIGRYLEFHGPSCDEHVDGDDECPTCRMDTAANDAIERLRAACGAYCVAKKALDGSAREQ